MASASQQEINSPSAPKRHDPSALGDVVTVPVQSGRLRFGVFEIDLENRRLWKRGVVVKLQQKPFQILQRLLQTPGELVTRSELARVLWPELHVVFDGSLNTAVNSLRRALGDPSREPRFIETIPGAGYRLLAPVKRYGEPSRSPGNPDANRDYLKGRYFYNKLTEEDLRKSVAYFESALAADPQFAPAHAGLAETYSLFAFLGIMPGAEAHRRARKFAEAALRIDRNLAEAHVAIAGVKKLYDWDWPGAEAAYRRALELNPKQARAHQLYASHLSAMGRHQEAVREIRLALEMDPLSLVIGTEAAWTLYMARDFESAMEQSWKTLTMEPKFAPAQQTLGLAYEQLELHEEAIVEFQNARVCSGDHPSAVAALGHAYAVAGERSKAEELLRELEQVSRTRYVSPYWLSILYCGLGEDARAFEALAKAHEQRDVWLVWLKVEPRFDRLRSDTRFQELLGSMGH